MKRGLAVFLAISMFFSMNLTGLASEATWQEEEQQGMELQDEALQEIPNDIAADNESSTANEITDRPEDNQDQGNDDSELEVQTDTQSESTTNDGAILVEPSAQIQPAATKTDRTNAKKEESDVVDAYTTETADEAIDSLGVNGQNVSFNTNVSGLITMSSTIDSYTFNVPSSGNVNFNITAQIARVNYYIYDSNNKEVLRERYVSASSVTGQSQNAYSLDLTAGTYILHIEKYSNSDTGNYNFKLTYQSAGESFAEVAGGSNNSFATANTVALNQTYKGQIALNDDKDFYKFTLANSGNVKFIITAQIKAVNYYIYQVNGEEVYRERYVYADSVTGQSRKEYSLDLTSGTYYMCVERYTASYTGNYSFSLNFTSANESFKETQGGSNNSFITANRISLNTSYNGQLALNDKQDYYKFSVPYSGTIKFDATAKIKSLKYHLYNGSGKELFADTWIYADSVTGQSKRSYSWDLSKGDYYVCVTMNSGYTGNYNFKVGFFFNKSTPQLTATNTTYNKIKFSWSKISGASGYELYRSPSKNGTYSKIKTLSGGNTTSYTDTNLVSGKTYYYKVRAYKNGSPKYYTEYSATIGKKAIPKTVSLSRISAGKKKATITWKRQTGVSGYEVYMSAKASGGYKKVKTITSASTVKFTKTNLTSYKNYYFKVRSYKKVNGTNIYGEWSTVKWTTAK